MTERFKYFLSVSVGWLISSLTVGIACHEISIINIALSLLPFAGTIVCCFAFGRRKFLSIYVLIIGMIIMNLLYLFRLRDHILLDVMSITAALYFIMMTVFMVKAPSTEPNSTFGIRIPATSDHKEVWYRTHRFLSEIIAGFLPASFLLIFFWSRWGRFWSSVALVIIPLLISSIYAGIIGRPYEREEAEELKKQIQKEQGYR